MVDEFLHETLFHIPAILYIQNVNQFVPLMICYIKNNKYINLFMFNNNNFKKKNKIK